MHVARRSMMFLLIIFATALFFVGYAYLSIPKVNHVEYGVSFNTPYAQELGLPWEEVYTAILDDLQVRHLRLAAHWTMVQPEGEDMWNFTELDTQVRMAEERGADIVFAVGRRLPRWPECHVPEWAKNKSWEEQKALLRTYITTVVSRYKSSPAVVYWQVENEPFLGVYAREQCGELDVAFLDEEVALVRTLDPSRPVLVTDSGNLGLWHGAYRRGDAFGTSVYLYLWNEATGPVKSIFPPDVYMFKRTLMSLLFGKKETMLIELSVEPWLNKPVPDVDVSAQLERMNVARFEEILAYAKRTRMEKQYVWGAEWWYWLKVRHQKPEMWEHAKATYLEAPRVTSGSDS